MAIVTLRSKRVRNEEGAKDPDEEEEEKRCTHIATKDWNKSYYTEDIRSSKLHDLLSSRHRATGKDVHKPVGNISKPEG